MKRILFLGGAPTQIPPIKYALEQGYYIITCDYLPENPGHKLAHEYHNVSTTDKKAVLELAKKLKIDGIVAYASDLSAPTAAYVAEKLELSGNSYELPEKLTSYSKFYTKYQEISNEVCPFTNHGLQ
jgi:formate-dependent phosphoribosylglycinamide formyltransferase (GAR transformylase)